MTFQAAVYWLVRQIPEGRLMAYGQVATALGYPRAARAVGGALRVCPDDLPWWRVVNRRGQVSTPVVGGSFERQVHHLRREGVIVEDDGSLFLPAYAWWPDEDIEEEIRLLSSSTRLLDQGV